MMPSISVCLVHEPQQVLHVQLSRNVNGWSSTPEASQSRQQKSHAVSACPLDEQVWIGKDGRQLCLGLEDEGS